MSSMQPHIVLGTGGTLAIACGREQHKGKQQCHSRANSSVTLYARSCWPCIIQWTTLWQICNSLYESSTEADVLLSFKLLQLWQTAACYQAQARTSVHDCRPLHDVWLQHVSTQAPAVRHSQTYRPHTIWGAVPW